MKPPLMKCGHAANATDEEGRQVCVICIGINPGADEIDENPPILEGRMAKCTYCKSTMPSSTELPFFTYLGDKEKDDYYCGCRGWD
jgi:hypothetical protein